jgi:hypothetical protein
MILQPILQGIPVLKMILLGIPQVIPQGIPALPVISKVIQEGILPATKLRVPVSKMILQGIPQVIHLL